jgi:SAM-dependent methyltransferase
MSAAAVGSRYVGQGAAEYWAYQEPIGRQGVTRDFAKIAPFVAPGSTLLEFGCGGAFMLERLSGAERIGVEANDIARAAAIERGLDIRAALSDAPSDWADVVYSHHVLEHVLEPFTVLTGLLAALRPGGQLVLVLPIDDWRQQRGAIAPDVNGHLWTWTPLLIRNVLAEAGFVDVQAQVVAYSWPRGARLLVHVPAVYRRAAAVAGRLRGCRELRVTARRP